MSGIKFGIKNPFAARSATQVNNGSNVTPAKPNLAAKGYGISQFTLRNPFFSKIATPSTKVKTSPIATGNETTVQIRVEEAHKIAAAKTHLMPSTIELGSVGKRVNNPELYTTLLESKTYFPQKFDEVDKIRIRQGLQSIQKKIDDHRSLTIEKKTAEKQNILSEQKAKDVRHSWFVSELSDTEVAKRVREDHSPVLQGAELATLTAAVAAAARPVGASSANIANALKILEDLDLESAVKKMNKEPGNITKRLQGVSRPAVGSRYEQDDENLAWRIAYKLASSESAEGFKLLKSLQNARKSNASDSSAAPGTDTTPGVRAGAETSATGTRAARGTSEITPATDAVPTRQPTLDEMKKKVAERSDVLLRTFLRAGQMIVDEMDQHNAREQKTDRPGKRYLFNQTITTASEPLLISQQLTPGALFRATQNAKELSPAEKACLLFAKPEAKAEAARGNLFTDLAGKAIKGVQNNFDAIETTGELPTKSMDFNWAVGAVRNGFRSEKDPRLVYAEGRVEKMAGAWIDRASAPTTMFKAIKRFVMPFKDKTPFDAISIDNMNHQPFEVAESTRLGHNRAMANAGKKIVQALEASLKPYLDESGKFYRLNNLPAVTNPSQSRENLELENQTIIENVVRHDLMDMWSKIFPRTASATTLGEAEKRAVRDAALAKLGYPDELVRNGISGPDLREKVENVLKKETERGPVTTKTLEEIAANVEFPEDSRATIIAALARVVPAETMEKLKARHACDDANWEIFRQEFSDAELQKHTDTVGKVLRDLGAKVETKEDILNPLSGLGVSAEIINTLKNNLNFTAETRKEFISELACFVPPETLVNLLHPKNRKAAFLAEVQELTTLVNTGEVTHAYVDLKGKAGNGRLKTEYGKITKMLEEKNRQLTKELHNLLISRGTLDEAHAELSALAKSPELAALELRRKGGETIQKAVQNIKSQYKEALQEQVENIAKIKLIKAEVAELDGPGYLANAKRNLMQAVRRYFKLAELGSIVELYNGGSAGVNTGAVISLAQNFDVSSLSTAVVPLVEIGAGGGRAAVCKLGIPTTGPVIFLGTEEKKNASLGVGASFLLGSGGELLGEGKVLGLSARADVGIGMDYTNSKGVALTLPRLDGVVKDKEGAEQITRVFETLLEDPPTPSTPVKEMSRLKRALQEHDVSVDVVRSKKYGKSANASAGASGGAVLDGVNLGWAAKLAINRRGYKEEHRNDTGYLRTFTSVKKGRATTVSAGANIFGSRGFDAVVNTPKTDGIDVLGASGAIAGIMGDVYKSGSVIRSTLTKLDGEASPRSFRFVTYANAADFEKAVNQNIGHWAHCKAKRESPLEYDAGGYRRTKVVNETLERITAFVQDAVTRATPMEEFSQYLELAVPAVKAINDLQGSVDFMRQVGDKEGAEMREKEIKKIFESADSWEERFLVIGERAKVEKDIGLVTGVRYAQTSAKLQSKILYI